MTETRKMYVLLSFGNLDSCAVIQGYTNLIIRGERTRQKEKLSSVLFDGLKSIKKIGLAFS